MHRSYRIGDTKFGVRTTSKAFGSWLDAVLSPYRYRRRVNPRYSIVVSGEEKDGHFSGKRFHILYRGNTQHVRTLDLPTLGRAFLAELETLGYSARDDAIYLDASVVVANGVTGLVPSALATSISRLGRRVEQAGLQLTVASTVAVDIGSGRLIPPAVELDIPQDAIDQLRRMVGGEGHSDRTELKERRTVDLVAVLGASQEAGQEPITKASAVYRLGAFALNLPKLRAAEALQGLTRLVEGARCVGLGGTGRDMLPLLTGAMRA